MKTTMQERYTPVVVAANSIVNLPMQATGGFLCQTNGTITLETNAAEGVARVVLLNAFPVTAGVYYPLPAYLGSNGGRFTTAGGASGLLFA